MPRMIAGYTLPDSLNEPTPVQAQASKLKRDFEARVRTIRADRTLSDEGKRAMVARAWLPFKSSFDALRKQDGEQYASARRAQRLKLVGLKERSDPAAIVAFRDAMQRAEALPTAGLGDAERRQQEAAVRSLLNTADLAGDDVLARAVLSVALDRGLNDVVAQYQEQYPQEAEDIADYRRLLDFDPEASQLAYYVWELRTPPEVSAASNGFSGQTVEELAAQPVALTAETQAALRRASDTDSRSAPDWLQPATAARVQAQARADMAGAPRIEV